MASSQKNGAGAGECAGGAVKNGPIIVELTQVEAKGHNLAGNAPEGGIETQIELILTAGGMEGPTAAFMASKLSKGAISARKKIAEATRYEIRVISPPKTSTLLKPPKAKKRKG